ncbi:MAG: putative tryptophan/tyrosine transport system substrate-binding protein, partial [Bacteroidota bacterium]|nr:putative tryptophan/tyrosine transport system substrate-binding protein [Bacteroidota bacterium]
MELWIGALILGFLYAFMSVGIFITFRIQNFPDITIDGSFTTGAATAAVMIAAGVNPFLASIAAFFVGAIAGLMTGIIYTRLKINGLLAGILVMIGLYSINLHIMGRSNIPLLNLPGFVSFFQSFNPGLHPEIWLSICLGGLMLIFWLLVSLFFRTDFGLTMTSAGSNPVMIAANGVNVDLVNIFGIALSNGLVGLSGAMVAQYQGFADIGMGIGMVVMGLASVIVGESIFRNRSIFVKILAAIVGSVILRFMIAIALYVGMDPIDLKLLTALFVLLTLILSKVFSNKEKNRGIAVLFDYISTHRKTVAAVGGAIIIIIAGYFGIKSVVTGGFGGGKQYKIAVVQIADNGLMNITRDAFKSEMQKIGYIDGKNCSIKYMDANGDLPMVNSIIDKLVMEKYDVIVTLSTPVTQAAIGKVKTIPVVFATIANPFIIKAGSSDYDHLPNVTGVYGNVDMSILLDYTRKVMPGKLKIGAIWDPSHANSEFNIGNLRKAISKYPDYEFIGANVTQSTEVYQAAVSVIQKGANVFVLAMDNIVYSAFESVVKAARAANIPIFLIDISRLKDGAMFIYGYDYSSSGVQAAHIVDRILKGEDPKNIPFEQYERTVIGLNIGAAKECGIKFPPEIVAQADFFEGIKPVPDEKRPKIGILQFGVEPNVEFCKQGILKALAGEGYKDSVNINIVYKNANADFSMINSIMQDFIRRDVDIVMPLSTPCVQSAVQLIKDRQKPIVCFTYIYDPYRIGAATSPDQHLPNMTGIACFPPIEKMLDLIKEIFPERKNIGIVWNTSEANSESVLSKIRPYAKKIGLNIIESTVTNPSEVLQASSSLVSKGAQVFLNSGDNTLNVSFDSFVKVANQSKIPVFSVDADFINSGAFAALGPDYFQTGFEGGEYLGRILSGAKPATMPIKQTVKTDFFLNMDVARRLGFKLNDDLIKRADKVIDSRNQAKGKKKVAIVQFSVEPNVEVCRQGFIDALRQGGYIEGKNLELIQ